MHFHQLLRWCHEAYEESLEKFGIAAVAIFPTPPWSSGPLAVAVPIVHCRADFFRPLVCGDRLLIQLQPLRLDEESFEVAYRFYRVGPTADSSVQRTEIVAQGLTQHMAIHVDDRKRCPIPYSLSSWLSLNV
jgi:1,4-dihydroxy-2-naphthoyl-CoA hydrolase